MLSTSGFEDDYFSFQQRYKIAIYLTKLEHMIGKDAFVILLDQKLEKIQNRFKRKFKLLSLTSSHLYVKI